MIRRISISNYALIRDLTLEPSSGFNIITGETGAGKSIILGALALLQGKRFDSKSAAMSDEKSSVEAEVVMPDGSSHTLLREILPSGRSRAFIDGEAVSLAKLAEMASPLIDIHSQHQNLQLSDEGFQLETLDRLAKNFPLLEEYHKVYAEYRVALQNFARTRDEIERTRTDVDYLEYQLKEFSGLNLSPEEYEELEQTRERLTHSSEIASALARCADLLTWNEASASALISDAAASLRSATDMSKTYLPFLERLEKIQNSLNSIAGAIADEVAQTENDPETLAETEGQLERINTLKTKHRVDSIEELLNIRDSITRRLDNFHNSDATLHELEKIARNLKKTALEKATQLSTRRKEAAETLAKELMERARPLGMENLTVEINVAVGKLNPDGFDTVEFLFAFNKNQKPAPAANRASGGELSRVMLALKSITVEHQHTPTIIFDEIDTGVSGDVANRMARLMAIIGKHIQVITITHLPQMAARGDRHFKVFKRDDEISTRTYITELSQEERRSELALMLSGNASDTASLATADSLLNQQ